MASEQLEGIIAMLASARPGPDTPLEDQRRGYDALGALLPAAEGVTTEAIELGGIPAERHHPLDGDPDRAVLHLHGGGYCIGGLASHRSFGTHLARASGADVLVVDYRLAPEHPHPAALDDATTAWHAAGDLVAGGPLALSGDSAGGGLALGLAARLRDDGQPGPRALALLSPWTDLTCSGTSNRTQAGVDPLLDADLVARWARDYAGSLPLDAPAVSPLFADLHGLPPLLVHATDAELIADDATRLAERARAHGVEVDLVFRPGLLHTWHVFAGAVPEADEDVAAVGRFLAEHLR